MKKRLIARTLAIVAAVGWALSAQAQAQNANEQTAAGAADQGATNTDQSTAQNGAAGAESLQEVVVTAERRSVSIQQTPIVVTAIEGDELQSLHVAQVSDLQTTVPGFESMNEGGFVNLEAIRGLGNATSPAIQVGTKVIRDGIIQGFDAGLDQPMYDEADVEVLEGPQGTLVGDSAIAGAIEQNSVNPNFNGFNGYALVGGGNYTDVKFQGALNLPLSDTLALRLAFDIEQEHSFSYDIGDTPEGFYYTSYSATNPAADGAPKSLGQGTVGHGAMNDPGATDEKAFRLKALWKPTDNFQSLSEFEYYTNNEGGTNAEPNPATYTNLFSYPSGCSTVAGTTFTGTQFVCPGAGVTTHSTYYYPGEQPFVLDYYGVGEEYFDGSFQLSEELRYTLADGIVVRSLSGLYNDTTQQQLVSSNGPQDSGFTWHPTGPNVAISEELNVISPTTGKTNWIAGAFWQFRYSPIPSITEAVGAPYQPDTLPTTETIGSSDTAGHVAALFGTFNWQFTNTLQLQVGARENWDDNNVDNPYGIAPAVGTLSAEPGMGTGAYSILYTAAACGTITPPCYKVVSQTVSRGVYTDHVPTAKVDLNWTPLPGQNFYLFYSRGYSGGGLNATSVDHPVFLPETVNDWEAGWKGRVLDGHMLTQIGLYYEDVQNYQSTLEDLQASNDTAIGTYQANLPLTIYGLSAALQSRFGGLGVNLTFDYNHTALGNVLTLNQTALPGGFGSPLAYPQCVAGHTYASPLECFDYTPYQVNLSGEAIPFAPLITANIAVDYLFHVGAGTVDPRMTYSYTSTQYGSIFENSYNEMAIRPIFGASIDWVAGKWDTQLYSTNLNNWTYVTANLGSTVYYGPPRQFGLQVKYSFETK